MQKLQRSTTTEKIVTCRSIPNNIPDVVLTDKNKKKEHIIDIAVLQNKRTQSEKGNKYQRLADEVKAM